MRKLLVVYNTCGIYGRTNTSYYLQALNNILAQDLPDCKLAISTCCNPSNEVNTVLKHFPDMLVCNANFDRIPVSVTFNDTVEKCVAHFGEFEGYVYVDSGIVMNKVDDLRQLYELFSKNQDTISARTNTDTGYDIWFDTDSSGESLFEFQHLNIEVGKAVNLHVQIFSHAWLQAYKRILPDIFAGQSMESSFSFLAAAINKKWLVHKDIILFHNTGMDGPSSGFAPHIWKAQGNETWDHLFGTQESILDIIGRGKEYGMGYEEIYNIVIHNPDKFEENGYALDDRLQSYIRDNLFLTKEQFDYSKMNTQFIT